MNALKIITGTIIMLLFGVFGAATYRIANEVNDIKSKEVNLERIANSAKYKIRLEHEYGFANNYKVSDGMMVYYDLIDSTETIVPMCSVKSIKEQP